MAESIVEKVARAIFASQDWPEFHPAYEHSAEIFHIAARAAIQAMREPSEAMEEVGDKAMTTTGFCLGVYSAMITAALNEEVAE